MNILITGAEGFVGKNLVEALKILRDNKEKSNSNIIISEIYCYDKESTDDQLEEYCMKADFIFNLAGVNRPLDKEEFMEGNCDFSKILLEKLEKKKNYCSIMLASSIQASLLGRYSESDYGKSKLASENLFFDYASKTGASVLIYRFPNLFGKWIRPNYNSAVATFCNNIANDLPIQLNDKNTELELLYIDDLIDEMILNLGNNVHKCNYDGLTKIPCENGKYCYVPNTYKVTIEEVVNLLSIFRDQPQTLLMPEIPNDSFIKKLFSMYLTYLPKEKMKFPLKMNIDKRGNFTEILKTRNCGQFSVNISKPGITKGEHWHNSKWEMFIVVAGHGLIQERKVGTEDIIEFEVSGENLEVIYMIPGYVHSIINLSDKDDLVTLIWANEMFDSKYPDTFKSKI